MISYTFIEASGEILYCQIYFKEWNHVMGQIDLKKLAQSAK
jgi:hypothetical protein